MMVQSFIERLRPLVWMKGWDYIVLWKLSDDHRSIELMDCCCGGAENVEDLGFEGCSSTLRCRDVMFPHQRVKSCDLLDLVPSSMVLDSGVHAQALCSNQPSWLNYSHTSDSTLSQEAVGTRVLIPLTIGLVELFATKQVPEDEEVMDLIRIQSNIFVENQTMQKDEMSLFQQQQRLDQLPHDITAERIHLSSPSNGMFLEDGGGVGPYDTAAGIFAPSSMESAFQEMSNASRGSSRWMEDDQMMHEDSFACDNNNRSDDSDPNEEDDDPRSRRRNGKGPQSKNLQAERNRRKKLNDRLYALRALVPNISKLDRASILGDAIEYVKELQKTADELKLELEQPSDDEESARKAASEGNENNIVQPPTVVHPNGTKRGPKRESENFGNGYHRGSSCSNNNNMNISKQNHENELRKEKVQQMEPQVEVYQVDGNEFFVKVFCEYKFGGFVRIMEALNALGLEVANVNTTRHTCLASSIFKVERKNDENVGADDVKESLLELTRNPLGVWAMNGSGGEGEGEGEEPESKNEMENDYGMNQHHSFHHYQH